MIQLNEEQDMIRQMARKFAEKEIAPVSEHLWEAEEFPTEVFKKASELGLSGLPYSSQYGGGDGDWLSFAVVLEEFARVDCAIANSFMANSSAATLLNTYGTPEQKEKFLRPILSGEKIGAIGLTEPNAGSDAANIQCRAELDGDEWVINGSKIFISNTANDIVGPIILAAVTGKKDKGKNEISNFIFTVETKGFSYGRKLRKIGWRASSTGELFFDNCRIPKEYLLGKRGEGLKQTLSTISNGRILIASLALGILQGSLDRSIAYLRERTAFGKRLSEFQALRFKVADMATHTEAARLLICQAALLKDAGRPFEKLASIAKLFATEKAMEAAHQCIQIHGGYGIISEYPASRAFGDAKVLEIVEGTSEIQRMIISRMLLS